MNPGCVFGEGLQELGRSDCAAVASAGVLDVGNVALDLIGVLLTQGQAPELFAGGGQSSLELADGLVVVGERAAVEHAESDDAGAGEGCRVDEVGCAELAGVGESVGENQAAFGVGVDDVDGLAGLAGVRGMAVTTSPGL